MQSCQTTSSTSAQSLFVQVPVINKTGSLFVRNSENKITSEFDPDFIELSKIEEPIVTIKTDGTCALLVKLDDSYYLMRRQDIKTTGRNYTDAMNSELKYNNDIPYRHATMTRGAGSNAKQVPLHIYQLDADLQPEPEANHLIGFTPISKEIPEDKHIMSAIIGTNGTPDLIIRTTVFDGTPDLIVKAIPASELLAGRQLMTVEIMGPKVVNKYGFTGTTQFINPHGSIILPSSEVPELTYDSIKTWITNESKNRWADVEGLVFHFPKAQRRFKFHCGHLDMGKQWNAKKASGMVFHMSKE